VTLDEGQTANGLLTASDPDSDIEFFLVTEASLGAAAVTDSGAFTYVPNDGNVNGKDQFTFGAREVGDEELESTALVSVTINPVNDAPQITSRAVTSVQEESPYVYNITAADVEGDAISFSASALPAWLTLVDNGNGRAVLSGTPDNNDAGSYNVTVRVTDNGSPPKTATQAFTIRVAESNIAPRFTSNAVTSATEGESYNYNIRTTDVNGDALTISAPTLPSWLSFTDNGDGTGVLNGTPGESDAGNHNVTLRVIDNGSPALSANQSCVIVVGESKEAPRFSSNAVTSVTGGQR
jgi:VCBS repeat-containing protein